MSLRTLAGTGVAVGSGTYEFQSTLPETVKQNTKEVSR